MTGNEKLTCCSGDCEQGRLCPVRIEQRKQPINWPVVWHNFIHTGSFTIVERAVIVAIPVAILFSLLT